MTLREVIETIWLPQALTMGVDYTLFWTLNPRKLKPFIQAYKDKIKARHAEINLSAWLTGIYNRQAIVSALEPKVKYFDKPIEQTDEVNEMEVNAAKFEAWAMVFNKNNFGVKNG